jgi:hypothetical protein
MWRQSGDRFGFVLQKTLTAVNGSNPRPVIVKGMVFAGKGTGFLNGFGLDSRLRKMGLIGFVLGASNPATAGIYRRIAIAPAGGIGVLKVTQILWM